MDGFSFENKFCQHFKYLRENVEVFVSFNTDRWQSILNDKINISLCYNNKLDIENEKSRLDKFTVKSKLNKRGWQVRCEIAIYSSDFHYGSILFNREFAYITTSDYRRPIDNKTFVCFDLANSENRRQNRRQQRQYSKLLLVFWL